MPVFQPLIPTGDEELDVSYQDLQDNFHSINDTFSKDHIPFSDSGVKNGYHTTVHLVPVANTTYPLVNPPPTATAGYGQLFSATVNDGFATDQTLFWLTGDGNRTLQLTNNFTPRVQTSSSSLKGTTFIPGGLIIQWGFIDLTPSSLITETYNRPFPNKVLNIQVTRLHSTSSVSDDKFSFWVKSGPTLNDFQIVSKDGHTWAYNWVALGY
jgi:hypothetical protein